MIPTTADLLTFVFCLMLALALIAVVNILFPDQKAPK